MSTQGRRGTCSARGRRVRRVVDEAARGVLPVWTGRAHGGMLARMTTRTASVLPASIAIAMCACGGGDPAGRSERTAKSSGPAEHRATSAARSASASPTEAPPASTASASAALEAAASSSPPPPPPDRKPWSRRFGDTGEDHVEAVATDADGNVIVAGHFHGKLDLGAGEVKSHGMEDILLAKLSPAGTAIWSQAIGGADDEYARSVAVDRSGHIVVTGTMTSGLDLGAGPLAGEYLVAEFDADGKHLWSKSFWALGAAFDAEGHVVLASRTSGKTDFGAGPPAAKGKEDAVVVKLDADGRPVWTQQFASPKRAYAEEVAVDAAGNVFVLGSFERSLQVGDSTLQGADDLFLAKLDEAGAVAWSRSLGGKGDDYAGGIGVDREGNVIVAGSFFKDLDAGGGVLPSAGGEKDGFIVKYDPSGAHVWSSSFGGRKGDYASALAVDAAGNTFVTGQVSGDARAGAQSYTFKGGDSDAYVLRFDASGAPTWLASGSIGYDYGAAIAADPFGGVIVAGNFRTKLDFGSGELVARAGSDDGFVARLSP